MPQGRTDLSDLIARDHEIVDGLTTVRFTQAPVSGSDAGGAVVQVAESFGLTLSRREVLASQGLFDGSERVWWLPTENLDGISPRPGDKITEVLPDRDIDWYVTDLIQPVTFGHQWRLVCKRGR